MYPTNKHDGIHQYIFFLAMADVWYTYIAVYTSSCCALLTRMQKIIAPRSDERRMHHQFDLDRSSDPDSFHMIIGGPN
jgi:hypothetical protein